MRKHSLEALRNFQKARLGHSKCYHAHSSNVTVANLTHPLGGEDEVVNLSGWTKLSRTKLSFIPNYFAEGELCVTFLNV